MTRLTKEKAISIIIECACKYRDNLADRSLLFVCSDKEYHITTLEVSFDASNYLHLTGCKVRDGITASDFYNRCLNHKLSENDFELSRDGTAELKLQVLPLLITKNLSANAIGDYTASNPKLYTEKLAGSIKGCMGFVRTKTGRHVPNTVLNIDMRKYISNQLRVLATYRKKKKDDCYEELVYKAKNVDWSDIVYPEKYGYIDKPE
jgi:hypothetical protein